MKYCCLYILVFILAGCASTSVYLEPANKADRVLYYYELDQQGKRHPISSETVDAETLEATRVPNPALVDIDSNIRIKVGRTSKEALFPLGDENAEKLINYKEDLKKVLEKLKEVMTAREKVLTEYAKGIRGPELDPLIKDLATKKIDFLNQFITLYEKGTESYRDANRLIGKGGGLKALKPFLEEKISSISARDKNIQETAKNYSSTLRLEAFLDKPGEELVAIHIKGYDSLPEMRVAARDRWGLNLSEVERRELQRQIEATEKLALITDQIRAKEISIQEGIGKALHVTAPELEEQVKKAKALRGKLTKQERLDRVKSNFDKAIKKARKDLNLFGEEQLDAAAGLADSLPQTLKQEVGGINTLLKLIAESDEIVERWSKADSIRDYESIATLVTDTASFAGRINELKIKLPQWMQDAAKTTKTLLNQQVESARQDAMETLEKLAKAEELQAVVEDVQSYYADIKSAAEVVDQVVRLLKIGKIEVERVAPAVPEAFDVSIEDLQDTVIDLKRLPLKDGDSIRLRATYKDPRHKTEVSEPAFEITHYGWYAKLSPSVVLVKPTELASGDEGYRFAPALGWMHHYRPRPSAMGFTSFLRSLEPSLGIHSIFLNFDNESGIGLGATLSLWNDRLQFGAGYNLSADNEDNGRYYYYVGSDLIGLLQTVGIGK